MSWQDANWLALRLEAVGGDWRLIGRGRCGDTYWLRVEDRWTGYEIVIDHPITWTAHQAALADEWNSRCAILGLPLVTVEDA